ncbi:hypothetical protein TTRE_0000482801 [Trichuris trichiura]|uniref:Uncharacterized protein n=1 Tax=Trichuris trichiura TaxID=36087 RepID=A0A077ZA61_TRITR|nr:hypothetical protein TTRE_0000482801 [Trichuris trichiura]
MEGGQNLREQKAFRKGIMEDPASDSNILMYSDLSVRLAFIRKYFALDLQLIMGNRKYAMSAEDYVFASTCLFVDIVILFQYILTLLGEMEQ